LGPGTFKIKDFETNPQFVQIAPPSEPVVVFPFQIILQDTKFPMNLCFPYFALEPILKKLSSQNWIARRQKGAEDERHIKDVLKVTEVELTVELGRTEMSLRELLRLEEGDVLVLETRVDDELKVKVKSSSGSPGRTGRGGRS